MAEIAAFTLLFAKLRDMSTKINGAISNKITAVNIALPALNEEPADVPHEGQLIGDISGIGWNTFELECDGMKYADCRLTNIPHKGSFRYRIVSNIPD